MPISSSWWTRVPVLTLTLLLLLPVPSSRAAQEVDVVWRDAADLKGADAARLVEIRGPRTFTVAGPAPGDRGGTVLRVHDKRTGQRIWQAPANQVNRQVITGLETSASTVFLAGTGAGNAIVVQALATRDGFNEWNYVSLLGEGPVAVADLARSGRRLFLVGSVANRFMIRTLDARNGDLLWEDFGDDENEDIVVEGFTAATVRLLGLYVAGTRDTEPVGGDAPALVRRYNKKDGSLVWETEVGSGVHLVHQVVATDTGVVLVVGETLLPGTTRGRWVVYAISQDDGSLLWSDEPFGAANASSAARDVVYDSATDMAYVVGHVTRRSATPVIRAYEGLSGAVSWEQRNAGVREGSFQAIAQGPRGLVVGGAGREPGQNTERLLVQGFDPADGSLLWTCLDRPGPGRAENLAVDASNAQAVTGGILEAGRGGASAVIRLLEIPRP